MSLLREVARMAHEFSFVVTEDAHVGGITVTFDMGALAQGAPIDVCTIGPAGLLPETVAALLRSVADAIDPTGTRLRVPVRRAPVDEDDLRARREDPLSPLYDDDTFRGGLP